MIEHPQSIKAKVESSPKPTLSGLSKPGYLKILLFVLWSLTTVTGSVLAGYFMGANSSKKVENFDEQESIMPITTPLSTVLESNDRVSQWNNYDEGIFTMDYPHNWSIAEIDNMEYSGDNDILLAMSPNGISTVARGGTVGTIEIFVKLWIENADEIINKRVEDFKSSSSDVTQETISTQIGNVIYLKGKEIGEVYGGMPKESYFFVITTYPDKSDGKHVIEASIRLQDDPKLSEILRHIISSFREVER